MSVTAALTAAQAPADVGAGWTAFLVFAGMATAIVVLGFSLVKHLKRARANLAPREGEEPGAAPQQPSRPRQTGQPGRSNGTGSAGGPLSAS